MSIIIIPTTRKSIDLLNLYVKTSNRKKRENISGARSTPDSTMACVQGRTAKNTAPKKAPPIWRIVNRFKDSKRR